jgi:hypothetical protein
MINDHFEKQEKKKKHKGRSCYGGPFRFSTSFNLLGISNLESPHNKTFSYIEKTNYWGVKTKYLHPV